MEKFIKNIAKREMEKLAMEFKKSEEILKVSKEGNLKILGIKKPTMEKFNEC